MEVTAKNRAIIDWDADARQTVVINLGETGEISEKLARVHWSAWNDEPLPDFDSDVLGTTTLRDNEGNVITFGEAQKLDGEPLNISDEERARLPQLDHDADGHPGGSAAPEGADLLGELRKEYKEVVGKNFFPGWDAEELQRRIDEARAAAPDGADDDDDAEDGPPA